MSLFPTLTAMGITSLDQVARYTVKPNEGADELTIYFRRSENSFLPQSTEFRFTTPGKHSTAESDRPAIDSVLLSAISELDKLARKHQL